MCKRFSKSKALDELWNMANLLEKENGFQWGDGRAKYYTQIPHKIDFDTQINFGRYELIRDLIEDWQ